MKDNRIITISLYFGLVIVLLALQSMQFFSFGSISPDFIMMLTIIFSLSRGSLHGEIFGFIAGFALDLMSGTLFGLNAFVFTSLGALASPFQKIVKVPSIIVFIAYTIVGTFLKYLLYTIFYALYDDTSLFDWYYLVKIPSEMLFNVLVGLVIYIVIARFDAREGYDWF